ncbi:alpha-amylase family protein [Martelella mediterranea]|uniref:alpha-amylase family protein n=1 Tax=uncultured Martelella sp. TaxID=392331 RepID=UPI000D04F26B|nr:alpha-amylase family protein [uncultured Martelella sp.]
MSQTPAASHLRSADWFQTATRWTQLTFVENDPDHFDPAFWIDIFRRTGSNAVCLSAGGYMAFYPSKVPDHYISNRLEDRDIFGALVDGARRLDMHVMARVDPHAIRKSIAERRPDWVQRRADGSLFEHWAYADAMVVNPFGSYAFEQMPEIIREIVRDYDVDAVFANRWQGHGVDYSEDSARRFRDFSGLDLPRAQDAADPAWRKWLEWRKGVLTELIALWDKAVKNERPHASFIPNMEGSSLMEFDLSVIRRFCPFFVIDHQGRRGVEPAWSAGRDGKRLRANFPDRPVALISSVGPEDEFRWKDSVNTPEEIQLWINSGSTQGLRAWFTKFNGVVSDRRWIAPVEDAFGLHARMEPVLRKSVPAADVALVDPSMMLRHWAPEERYLAEHHEMGFYQALVEARIPFEMLCDETMTDEALDQFRVVVLANAAFLTDRQCGMIRRYVERGGSVVGAYETSLRDEQGELRPDFGLADTFGVKLREHVRQMSRNTYLALDGAHELIDGYAGAGRMIGGTRQIRVEAAGDAIVPLRHIPDFPDLPMEEVYARQAPSDPAMIARESEGGGRTVYFPWNIGEVFWNVLALDHARLIANAVRWCLARAPSVIVEGSGVVDLGLRRFDGGLALSLLNLTNPMMMKGPVRETIALPEQLVSLAVPPECRTVTVRTVIGGQTFERPVHDGRVELRLPPIERLEMVECRWK